MKNSTNNLCRIANSAIIYFQDCYYKDGRGHETFLKMDAPFWLRAAVSVLRESFGKKAAGESDSQLCRAVRSVLEVIAETPNVQLSDVEADLLTGIGSYETVLKREEVFKVVRSALELVHSSAG